jgi:Tol biopolymer transport system component
MRHRSFMGAAALIVVATATACGPPPVPPGPAPTPRTERASVSTAGAQGDEASENPTISGDGQFVAWASPSPNLVPDDTNDTWDVFVRDRETGETTRVSISSDGSEGDGPSMRPSISADGRYVAFDSTASNLDAPGANDAAGTHDVFVHDRLLGQTRLLSETVFWLADELIVSNGGTTPSISADGSTVAYESSQEMLDPLDGNGIGDIAVADVATGVVTRLPATSSGAATSAGAISPSISGNGRYVAFYSSSQNLVPEPIGNAQVFVHDRTTGTNTLVSVATDGTAAEGGASAAAISSDGRHVVFASDSPDLVPDDDNTSSDVFMRDLETATTSLMSVTSAGAPADSWSTHPSVSATGRYVVFSSGATNLSTTDGNGLSDVYVRDTLAGTTSLVSVTHLDTFGNAASGASALDQLGGRRLISDDGRFIAFGSSASNLVVDDTNNRTDVFVRDRTG